ncbi:peptide deformylase [Nakamurella leprariae]|uniref:peptide deformylase n=1 Tax=Nakamurella leprariae TaxID=2803911 RepID=UPI0038B37720
MDEVAGPSPADVVRRLLDGPRPLPLVTAGHPVLRHPAAPYDFGLLPELFAELIDAMRETMHAAPGVGLAAPQIGLGLAVAVLEDSAPVPDEVAAARDRHPLPFRVIVNPTYEAVGNERAAWYEGCLSVPGYQAVVDRAARVRLRCQDETGAMVDEEVAGWAARIVAHETDHLNGTLYLDRAVLRSLATHQATAAWWGGPDLIPARVALGF